jgi:EAL domain-containing protein (putative c-di-GMP-specific phosphodiesterase class I)
LIPETGTLCIAPPLAHTLVALRDLVHRLGIPFAEPSPNLMTVPLGPGVLLRLADSLGDALSRAELRDTRSLVVDEGIALTLAHLAAIRPLATMIARIQGDWFSDMLRDGRLTSHFHPIVRTEDPEAVFGYECLLRGLASDGSVVAPGRLYQVARDAEMMFSLDREARLTAIRCGVAEGLDAGDTRLFINFNPTSIYDPVYCLRSTVAAIAKSAFRPGRIVFEVVESDQIEDIGHLIRIVEYYRDAGFGIALDDLGSGYGSLNLLSRLKPDFVKLDMQLIHEVDRSPYKASIVRKLLEMARELGVETIAEGIETEAEWSWVREHGAEYSQGFLFARPESPPPRPRNPALTRHETVARE